MADALSHNNRYVAQTINNTGPLFTTLSSKGTRRTSTSSSGRKIQTVADSSSIKCMPSYRRASRFGSRAPSCCSLITESTRWLRVRRKCCSKTLTPPCSSGNRTNAAAPRWNNTRSTTSTTVSIIINNNKRLAKLFRRPRSIRQRSPVPPVTPPLAQQTRRLFPVTWPDRLRSLVCPTELAVMSATLEALSFRPSRWHWPAAFNRMSY